MVTVTNTGTCDGDEVVQVYCIQPETVVLRSNKSLVAFQRVNLKKGESKVINLEISPVQLRHFNSKTGDYSIAPGKYELEVGAASNDIKGKINIDMLNK
jgi:beta-glucosidase